MKNSDKSTMRSIIELLNEHNATYAGNVPTEVKPVDLDADGEDLKDFAHDVNEEEIFPISFIGIAFLFRGKSGKFYLETMGVYHVFNTEEDLVKYFTQKDFPHVLLDPNDLWEGQSPPPNVSIKTSL